jgi:hypothetical protein
MQNVRLNNGDAITGSVGFLKIAGPVWPYAGDGIAPEGKQTPA